MPASEANLRSTLVGVAPARCTRRRKPPSVMAGILRLADGRAATRLSAGLRPGDRSFCHGRLANRGTML